MPALEYLSFKVISLQHLVPTLGPLRNDPSETSIFGHSQTCDNDESVCLFTVRLHWELLVDPILVMYGGNAARNSSRTELLIVFYMALL